MGHKVHPTGFRVGVIYDWQSKWYAGNKGYKVQLHEDVAIRNRIMGKGQPDAGISKVEIDRNANQMTVTIHTAKPGIVIGRNGANVDALRTDLEKQTGRRVRVNINEIRVPELDSYLVARSIADQLQRRVAFRRAIKQGAQRTMQRGAKGIKIMVAGRLGGSEMSRRETEKQGRIPLHTLRADIDFGIAGSAHDVRAHRCEGMDLQGRHRARDQQAGAERAAGHRSGCTDRAARGRRGRCAGRATCGRSDKRITNDAATKAHEVSKATPRPPARHRQHRQRGELRRVRPSGRGCGVD